MMKYRIVTLAFVCSIFSCKSPNGNKQPLAGSTASSAMTATEKKTIRFFPERISIKAFDTVIKDAQLEVTITRKDLDSYVTREDDEQHIDRYRDAELSLLVKQKGLTLLDTIFRKEQFSTYADSGFMDIAIFHSYWFRKLDKNKIEFFGSLSEPETDLALDFNHYFDLTSKRLEFVERKNDVEYGD